MLLALLAQSAAFPHSPAPVGDKPPPPPPVAAPHEHVYDIESVVSLPPHGIHTFSARLLLTEHVGEDAGPDAPTERLYEMTVERNAHIDQHGAEHAITGKDDMRAHPFYYKQLPSGEISGVLHHPSEHAHVVGSKLQPA